VCENNEWVETLIVTLNAAIFPSTERVPSGKNKTETPCFTSSRQVLRHSWWRQKFVQHSKLLLHYTKWDTKCKKKKPIDSLVWDIWHVQMENYLWNNVVLTLPGRYLRRKKKLRELVIRTVSIPFGSFCPFASRAHGLLGTWTSRWLEWENC
jgi:hypothetical protein